MSRPRFRLGTALMVVALLALSLAVVTLTIQLQRTRAELAMVRALAEEQRAALDVDRRRTMAALNLGLDRLARDALGRPLADEGEPTGAAPGSAGGDDQTAHHRFRDGACGDGER